MSQHRKFQISSELRIQLPWCFPLLPKQSQICDERIHKSTITDGFATTKRNPKSKSGDEYEENKDDVQDYINLRQKVSTSPVHEIEIR